VHNFPFGKYQIAMQTIHTTQDLGTTLKAARKQLALTQPQLAMAAGVGVRFIVDLEAGKPTLRLENVLRVIAALGGQLQLDGLPAAIARSRSKP
jgi:y4mF family transcriptional regulator